MVGSTLMFALNTPLRRRALEKGFSGRRPCVTIHGMEIVVALVLVACLVWGSGLAVRTWWRRRQIHSKADHGRLMEDRAGEMLEAHGYTAISQHPEIKYIWTIDGENKTVTVTPDWLVQRDGLTFLVEVKTGGQANPNQAKTRRQLLEYYLFGEADGVVYFDADRDLAKEVRFPAAIRTRTPLWMWFTMLSSFAIAIFAIWRWLSC